jgi:hypothetical protein
MGGYGVAHDLRHGSAGAFGEILQLRDLPSGQSEGLRNLSTG